MLLLLFRRHGRAVLMEFAVSAVSTEFDNETYRAH
jgi:hypothetical protein